MLTIFVIFPLLTTIAVLIVIINLLTLSTIFASPQLLKPGNYPIISFLVTALVQGFIVVPAYCIRRLNFTFSSNWICEVFRFPYFVCAHLLTLNLVIVCVDRIIAIKLPLRYDAIVTKLNMLVAISVETFVVLVVDLLPFANSSTDGECIYTPWPSWSITVTVITIFLPIAFLTLTYAWIWLIAFRVAGESQPKKCDERTSLKRKITARVTKVLELRATKTASLLVGVFVLCWGPVAVYYMVESLCDHCITMLLDKNRQSVVRFSVIVLSFASSIVSPFVYCWRTREFQREFKKNLTRRHWRAARIALSFMQRGNRANQSSLAQVVTARDGETATMEHKDDRNLPQNSVKQCNRSKPEAIGNNNEGDGNEDLIDKCENTTFRIGFETQIGFEIANMEDGLQTTIL